MSGKKVVVIGAGFGGLSAAAYLAQAGYEVTIYEKNKTVGGRAVSVKKKGFTFDLGPNWYLMPDVFDEFFADFNSSVEKHFELSQLAPSYKVFTHETDYDIATWPDVAELFDSLDPGSSKRLEKLLSHSEKVYTSLREKGASSLPLGLSFHRSLLERFTKVSRNQDLQHVMSFMSVALGAPPQSLPPQYSVLSYADMGMGIWHPKGGFSSVVKAFESTAKKAGVSIKLHSPVEKIITDRHRVTGVVINGEEIACDIVVSGADYHHVETKLLDRHEQSYREKYWQKQQSSPSMMVAYMGVKKPLPGLRHHNLLFDVSWERHQAQMYETKEWSSKPSVYVGNPSKTDSTIAPKGSESLVIMAPMAHDIQPTEEQLERTTLSIVGRLQEELGYEFINDIVVADVKAHDYFADTFNAFRGSAFGLSHIKSQSGSKRPHNKSKKVKGLYFTGQDTNPGTGVPMVILSGKQVAELIQKTEH